MVVEGELSGFIAGALVGFGSSASNESTITDPILVLNEVSEFSYVLN